MVLWIMMLALNGCTGNKSPLEIALEMAGKNRGELEKVLDYYDQDSADSLKLKAARFLIRNMPGHYSYNDSLYMNSYYNEIDSVATVYKQLSVEEKDSLFRQVIEKYNNNKEREVIADIEYVTSKYLIDNIEHSFKVWQQGEWATHVNFDDFCEYILPYKVAEYQTLDSWRTYFSEFGHEDLNKLKYNSLYKNMSYKACESVNGHLKDIMNPRIINEAQIPIRRMKTLANIPFGTCDDYSIIALAVTRANGIPTAIDFTPQWPFRSLGHEWNVLLENTGKNVVFEGANTAPGTPHKKDHKLAKVFRKTYAINEEVRNIHFSEQYIPSAFKNYHIKDVTDDYMISKNIEIKIREATNAKYAYLAVFDNENWVPVHWGKLSKNKIMYESMGRDIVYLPVYYGAMGSIPFDNPFLLTSKGEMVQVIPDTLSKRTLTLYRKYPAFNNVYEIGDRVIGGEIQAADNPNFNNPVVVHTITDYGITAKEVKLDSIKGAYRYWRYFPPRNSHSYSNMAELSFFEGDSTQSLKGEVIGTDGSLIDDRYGKEALFDEDILTFFDAPLATGCWAGMDFGKPVEINRLRYVPRGDGNTIETGDEYELFYWDDNTWQSLGRRVADNVFLTYDNCPGNALFLLRNHTKGKEERIFTYENEEQVWW